MKRHHETKLLALSSPIALCLACSRGEVDLGGGMVARDLEVASRCGESPIIDDSVRARNQGELDALADCEEITGSLLIETFVGVDLSPLASLRVIGENLSIGAQLEMVTGSDEEYAAQDAYINMQLEQGGFESLHGFEALQSIGGALYLNSILAEDLAALTNLREIENGLIIYDAKNLVDFSGLDDADVQHLSVEICPVVQSLNGLNLNAVLQGVLLRGLPALTNVDALGSASSILDLSIEGTALVSFPELTAAILDNLNIGYNLELVDASGLGGALYTQKVVLQNNPKLESLPDFSGLGAVDEFVVRYNDALEELSLDFPALQPRVVFGHGEEGPLSAAFVDIDNNMSLRRITSPASFTAVQYFNVYSNPSLTELDFGPLERIDFLTIDDNAALETVGIPSLASVDSLTITSNPAFVPSVFDDVPTFTRQINGNASAP